MYEITWRPKAIRQLEKLRDSTARKAIWRAADTLKNFPDCRNVKALTSHVTPYRLRVGRFRVFFDVQQELRIAFIEEVKKRDERTY